MPCYSFFSWLCPTFLGLVDIFFLCQLKFELEIPYVCVDNIFPLVRSLIGVGECALGKLAQGGLFTCSSDPYLRESLTDSPSQPHVPWVLCSHQLYLAVLASLVKDKKEKLQDFVLDDIFQLFLLLVVQFSHGNVGIYWKWRLTDLQKADSVTVGTCQQSSVAEQLSKDGSSHRFLCQFQQYQEKKKTYLYRISCSF